MKFEDYKIVLYPQDDGAWVEEIPALARCYALMKTREEVLAELPNGFSMIEHTYREKGDQPPADSTEIVNA
jgi:predicted RNase H-like HicB family nuclease